MADLAGNTLRFTEKKLSLAVIGSGEPAHFKAFREATGYRGPLYTDPTLDLFSVLGFSSGLTGIFNLKSAARAISALRQGFRQGPVQGSALQLGGALVIDTDGNILYRFAAVRAGDHPDPELLLAAADS